jgi:hypothetical protein
MAKRYTMNESLAALVREALTKLRNCNDDWDELGPIDSDLQAVLSLLGKVKTIPAGTIGALDDDPDHEPVVAVIELTQAELEGLTEVCGHDGFGMVPEAAEAILADLAEQGGRL